MSTCTALRADGAPCKAYALAGEPFCFTHHPDLEDERADARRAGGHARAAAIVPAAPPSHALRGPADVTALVSDVIGLVLHGELDARTANTVGYLCTVLLKSVELGELEDRLMRMETATRPGMILGLIERDPDDQEPADPEDVA